MNVIPVLYGPFSFNIPTIDSMGLPFKYSNEKTLQKIVIPQIKLHKVLHQAIVFTINMYLTKLLIMGVVVPNLTAPCSRFMYVAYVKNKAPPAPF